MRVRRRQPCFLEINDTLLPDFARLLRGEVRWQTSVNVRVLCPLGGAPIAISADEAAFIAALSAEHWRDCGELAQETGFAESRIIALAQRGAIVGDCDDDGDDASAAVREGEARLQATGWHPHAALYHARSAWHDVTGEEGRRRHDDEAHRERLQAHADAHGPLPPHFHRRDDAHAHVALPPEPLDDAFAATLRARRTTRHFRSEAALPLADFNRVLFGTFGALGTETLAPGMVALKRTSASGGGLHPIEAYPLVIHVEGLVPGFYHYEAASHSLALLEALSVDAARALAAALTIGQDYFAEAHALVFHVARLDRHHWKYRNHPKAYKAVLLDSGHLSQTFYLLAAERGLGAFYTAAINDTDVATHLRLRALQDIVIGANGVGVADPDRDALHLKPTPYRAVAP